jgi:hypothetical protein
MDFISAAIGSANGNCNGKVQTSPDHSDSIDHIVNRQYNNLRHAHAIRDNTDNAPRPFEISIVAFDRHVYFYVVIFRGGATGGGVGVGGGGWNTPHSSANRQIIISVGKTVLAKDYH